LDLQLLFQREVEEGFALSDDIEDQRFIDAGVLNVEEADFEEGVAEGGEERRLAFGITA
jgi:hypothetical protein